MLIELGQQLASERDPWRVLENFCKSARQIIDAEESAVGVLDNEGNNLRYFSRNSSAAGNGSNNQIPRVAQKALDQVITRRGPARLSESDELLQEDEPTSFNIRSFLGAPIFSAGRVCGWVYMLNKVSAAEFSEADERLAATMATQVAIAYENATMYTDAQLHATKLQLEIAERKQAEEQRAEMLVREQAARTEAEQANRTKDEFLATLSHELRTPLTAILGWSHLVRTGKLEPVQLARALETIERNARSQSQLIDDLLDVSRIITGKLQIEPRAVDLCSIIEGAVEAVRPSFEVKSITLETALEAEACFVLGDANRLQQVFWNLLSNAVKFTPESGTVRIETKRMAPMVRVSVSDSGIGIKPEFLPFIFDRFRQADGSTTRVHGGLGLGLSIVKHLVQMHSGSVQVESQGQNKGAVFSVDFPLASASAKVVSPNGAPKDAEMGSLPAGFSRILEGLRILVVDDEADARELVRAILSGCGGEVNCCESAAEALDAIRDWKPDLLVSDIGMPNEDGYSLIKKVRKLRSKRSTLPAVALTAYATKEDKARALATGFTMHVAKPIEPETLVMSIASTVGRKM